MDQAIAPELGTVQETLLIPLYGRAVETRDPDGMLRDPKALEMVAALDYDFARFDGKPSLFGSVFRTLLFDHWIRAFLAERPTGTVVEIGCGLNTRYERTDNGRAHWLNLDLPDAIALRLRLFGPDGERRRTVGGSVLDEPWLAEAAALPGPLFFSAEAVLPYLSEEEVRGLMSRLAHRFPGSLLATDAAAASMVDTQDEHDALSLMAARMQWHCDDARTPESWHPDIRLLETRTFTDYPTVILDALPAPRREFVDVMTAEVPEKLAAYRLNLYRLGDGFSPS
ncbi:class I SAM-dependent methyltransferase [Streptomyces boninensis]|uniref:class I SAM-dependent methyltransferase n=1 Tax=Streptomyces boninensis TaxID=2039455 RepID=UPI003B20E5F9